MVTFVLIHDASSDSWYWHLVIPELTAKGYEVVAPDLPCDDNSAGLAEYTDAVVDAIGTPFEKPWPLEAWPDVPTRFLLCRDDRFFPAEVMRRVVRDRLGITPDEMDGGRLPALSRPKDLARRLEGT